MSDIIKDEEEEVIFDVEGYGAKFKFTKVESNLYPYKLRTEFYNKGHVFYSGTASVQYKDKWTDIIFIVSKVNNFSSDMYEDMPLVEDILAPDKLVTKYHNDQELVNDIGEMWKGQVTSIFVMLDGSPYTNKIGTYFYNSIPPVTDTTVVRSIVAITLGILLDEDARRKTK